MFSCFCNARRTTWVAERARDRAYGLDAVRTHPACAAWFSCLIAASAFCMALAVKDVGPWVLGWVSLLPLFVAIRLLKPLTAGICGAAWGGLLFLFGSSSLGGQGLFGGAEWAPFLLVVVPAVYAWLGSRLTRHIGYSPYLLALGWIAVEIALRPVGLREGLLTTTLGDGVLVSTVGGFAGYALIGFVVAYINASLLSVLSHVRGVLPGLRLVRSLEDSGRLIVLPDVPNHLFHLIRPSRPRAPPIAL